MFDLEKLIFGNAAGTVKSPQDVGRMCQTAANRITVGSITREKRDGNMPTAADGVYYYHPGTKASINSLGLPNRGIEEYELMLPEMIRNAHAAGKELWASVAGFSPEDFVDITLSCLRAKVDGVELNLGCPNIHSKEGRKPIFSLHPEMVTVILSCVRLDLATAKAHLPLGVKISPTENEGLLRELAKAIEASEIVSEVVAVNTIPDQQLTRADGLEGLSFTTGNDQTVKHAGGLAGAPLQEIGPRVVSTLRSFLPPRIRLIGCGGIFSGADALAYLQAGAVGFECATAYIQRGPRLFSEIITELDELRTENAP